MCVSFTDKKPFLLFACNSGQMSKLITLYLEVLIYWNVLKIWLHFFTNAHTHARTFHFINLMNEIRDSILIRMQIVNRFFNETVNMSGDYTLAFVAAVLIRSNLIRQFFNGSCSHSIAIVSFRFVSLLFVCAVRHVFVWLINANHNMHSVLG